MTAPERAFFAYCIVFFEPGDKLIPHSHLLEGIDHGHCYSDAMAIQGCDRNVKISEVIPL